MKTKEKIKDLQRRSKKELEEVLKEKRELLRNLNFDLQAGKVKNISEVRAARKDTARILTLLKQNI